MYVSFRIYIFQLSYGSSSPILSDRTRFPTFFRLAGPDQNLNPSKIALMELFNWKKVATINQALEFFSVVSGGVSHFVTNRCKLCPTAFKCLCFSVPFKLVYDTNRRYMRVVKHCLNKESEENSLSPCIPNEFRNVLIFPFSCSLFKSQVGNARHAASILQMLHDYFRLVLLYLNNPRLVVLRTSGS